MRDYKPGDGRWEVCIPAQPVVHAVREQLGEEGYAVNRHAFQEFMCAYFNMGDCSKEQGGAISPVGGAPKGWKAFKVRWGFPGSGKSGGMRLAVVVNCDVRRVKVAGAWWRSDNPGESEFCKAVDDSGSDH